MPSGRPVRRRPATCNSTRAGAVDGANTARQPPIVLARSFRLIEPCHFRQWNFSSDSAIIGGMSSDSGLDILVSRLGAIEHEIARIARRLGESRCRGKRDGRAVLSVRVGDDLAPLVRRTARHRGCTIAELLRPAMLAAVAANQPSTGTLTEPDSGQVLA